jgi:cell division protein FtsZ
MRTWGGTGTGAAPVVADLAKRAGALTIGVVTLPFTVEGQKRIENAQYGLEKLAACTDTLIVIPNDKLLEIAPELPIHTAFKVADEILTNSVKGITELITKAGLVNLDFADVKAVMSNGGVSLIGIGESDSKDRAKDAVEKAIKNPLLDVDITNAAGALVNVIGGPDMSLEEYKIVMEVIGAKVAPDAKIISGAQISADMDKAMKVLLIVTGVKSSQIVGISTELGNDKTNELEEALGIDFLKEDSGNQ